MNNLLKTHVTVNKYVKYILNVLRLLNMEQDTANLHSQCVEKFELYIEVAAIYV